MRESSYTPSDRLGVRHGSAPRIALTVLAWSVGCALLAPRDAGATAAWLPAHALTDNTSSAYGVPVAADSQGTVTMLWARSDGTHYRIYAAVRPPGGAYGAGVPISPAGADAQEPALAVDSHGDALAVWSRNGIIETAWRPAGGSFELPQEISLNSEGSNRPRVVFNSAGEAVILWAGVSGTKLPFTYRLETSTRAVNGTFTLPRELDSREQTTLEQSVFLFAAKLVADEHGDVFAAWSFSFEERFGVEQMETAIRTSERPAGGIFPKPTTIASSIGFGFTTDKVREADIAADPQGDDMVVWEHYKSTGGVLEGKFRPAGGNFEETPESVSNATKSVSFPHIAFDRNGNAIAAFDGLVGSKVGVLEASRPAGGGFSNAKALSEEGAQANYPTVMFTPSGEALVAFDRYSEPSQVMVASRPPGGSFGSAQPVSPVGTSGGVSPPALATDGLGDAVLTWTRIEKAYVAEVAGYDNAPPSLLALNIPAIGIVGQSVAFSVAPLDVWSALAPTSWSFGDGTTATGTSVTHTYTAPGVYNVTVTSADVLGNLASSSGPISVVAPSASVLPPPAPALTGASESNRVWRRGRKLVSYARAHRPPVGTTFSFNLDQRATVRFAFTRRVGGRLAKHRCVRQTKANRHRRACKLTVTEGVLTFAGHPGRNRVYFQGRVSSRKTLPVGKYTVLISATNPSKERSQTRSLSFTIVA